jgi:hypothetical protein
MTRPMVTPSGEPHSGINISQHHKHTSERLSHVTSTKSAQCRRVLPIATLRRVRARGQELWCCTQCCTECSTLVHSLALHCTKVWYRPRMDAKFRSLRINSRRDWKLYNCSSWLTRDPQALVVIGTTRAIKSACFRRIDCLYSVSLSLLAWILRQRALVGE